jgi:hypothetical protein
MEFKVLISISDQCRTKVANYYFIFDDGPALSCLSYGELFIPIFMQKP